MSDENNPQIIPHLLVPGQSMYVRPGDVPEGFVLWITSLDPFGPSGGTPGAPSGPAGGLPSGKTVTFPSRPGGVYTLLESSSGRAIRVHPRSVESEVEDLLSPGETPTENFVTTPFELDDTAIDTLSQSMALFPDDEVIIIIRGSGGPTANGQ